MKFAGMFFNLKTEGLFPKPTGQSDYDAVERLEQIFDEQTDDLQGFPVILK